MDHSHNNHEESGAAAQNTDRIISAQITSNKRKIQLEFAEKEDSRSLSANKAVLKRGASPPPPQRASQPTRGQLRPKTIEGIAHHQPAPPANEKHRSFRTLSPREISLIAQEAGSVTRPGTSAAAPPRNRLLGSRGIQRMEATRSAEKSPAIINDSNDSNSNNGNNVNNNNASSSRPLTAGASFNNNNWSSADFDSMIPSFIKSTASLQPQQQNLPRKLHQSSASSTHSTNPAVMEAQLQLQQQLKNRLKAKSGTIGEAALAQATQIKRIASDDPRRKQQHQLFASSSIRDYLDKKMMTNKPRRLKGDDESIASTAFEDFDLDDALHYLWDASSQQQQQLSSTEGKAPFVHVASRYHVEPVFRENFYDLVVLERPGHPSSGFVWNRRDQQGKYANQSHVLPRHHVMQLSLYGLLVPAANGESGSESDATTELIPIEDLLLEKDQLDFLRTGNFFGMFKELKAFSAWKHFTHRSYVSRQKRLLMKRTFFSDSDLVEALTLVAQAVYDIETTTELFCFSGKGAVLISDFLAKQMEHTEVVRRVLHHKLTEIGDAVAAKHALYMSSKKLEHMIQEVKNHHPLHTIIEHTEDDIDWVRLRSVQRLGDNFKDKVKNILYMAQYRVEYAMACIVERFWLRMKQTLLGIHQVLGERKTGNANYWELNYDLFETTGRLKEHAYDANINLLAVGEAAAAVSDNNNSAQASPIKPVDVHVSDSPHHPHHSHGHGHHGHHSAHLHLAGKKVLPDWEKEGSHLCIHVQLFFGDRLLQLEDLVHLVAVDQVKIQVTPTKSNLMNQIHMVCGQIGRMFEALPNLKQHSLIVDHVYKKSFLDEDVELGLLGDLQNAHSSAYFTYLVLFPLYNSRHGYTLAVETIRLVQQAYLEASAIEYYVFKLSEVFRKLWSLSPTSLVKQLDRSIALSKIKDYVERPDMVEDLKRSQQRDKGRLSAFINAVEYLHDQLPVMLQSSFLNLKHKHGLITSFYPILNQVRGYRSIQDHYLHLRLPNAFVTRCSIFYDFVRKLEVTFDSSSNNSNSNSHPLVNEEIRLMQRLKNFENAKEFYDAEVEICEVMYQTIVNQKNNDASATADNNNSSSHRQDVAIASLLFQGHRGNRAHHAPALTPEKLFKVCMEAMDRLTATISRARSNLLSQLNEIRHDLLSNRQTLKLQISDLGAKFRDYSLIVSNDEVDEVNIFMTSIGKEVDNLHILVDESVSGQMIMTEAHDVVGAANPIMMTNEVDRFEDMDKLEQLYHRRCSAWKIIVEIEAISDHTAEAKLGNNNIADLNSKFVHVKDRFEQLSLELDDLQLIDYIRHKMMELLPRVELVSFLSSKSLRPRHWTFLSKQVFRLCGLELRLSGRQLEFVTVLDIKGREPVGLGNMNRLAASELLSRGLENHLAVVRLITSNALVEWFLEQTLSGVEEAIRGSDANYSSNWLRDDKRLLVRSNDNNPNPNSNKQQQQQQQVYIAEVSQLMNITRLQVMSRYCWKALMLVEATSQDLCLSAFDYRLDKLKDATLKIDHFFEHFHDVQFYWYYLLPFCKFSGRGEMDRDSIRAFNNCSEDMKKVESILGSAQKSGGNLLLAFQNAVEHDLNAEGMKTVLQSVLDDAHGAIQSLLDACPRLSLMSYNRLVALFKTWIMMNDPAHDVEFLSSCLREMFDGIGLLRVAYSQADKAHVCIGFVSLHGVEKVTFMEAVSFALPLDEFVKSFESNLRRALEKSCDTIVLHRINCMRALLIDQGIETIAKHIQALFAVRHEQLLSMVHNDYLTSTYLLVNQVSFAEDVWMSLGHPSGCLTVARPGLAVEIVLFSKSWRSNLIVLKEIIAENIKKMQEWLLAPEALPRTDFKKSLAIMSALLLQEISFLRTVEELDLCSCLESVTELWAGKFQLRFEYEKEHRHRNCPFEVCLGNITVPYGLEYQEAGACSLHTIELEYALSRVLSSAFSLRGTTFVNTTSRNYNAKTPTIDNVGEYKLSGKDIAVALGRICTTLSDASSAQNIRFFFARSIYLDAVGCIDFSTIDQHSLESFIQTAQLFWSAIENKNDQFIQDSLKFPLKAKFNRNELQAERRKVNLQELRLMINERKKNNTHLGLLFIGFASESDFQSLSVSDHFYRSIFDSVTVEHARALDSLGLLLTSKGFLYGSELQSSLVVTITGLMRRAEYDTSARAFLAVIKQLNTFVQVIDLCEKSAQSLRITRFSSSSSAGRDDQSTSFHHKKKDDKGSKVTRFADESISFCSNLWEQLLDLSAGNHAVQLSDYQDFFREFISKMEAISSEAEVEAVSKLTLNTIPSIRGDVNLAINRAAQSKGFICNHQFVQGCAVLWDHLSWAASPVLMVAGDHSSGKTASIQTVIATIDRVGLKREIFGPQSWPVRCRAYALLLFRSIQRWYKRVLELRAEEERYFIMTVNNQEKEQQRVVVTKVRSMDSTDQPAAAMTPQQPGSADLGNEQQAFSDSEEELQQVELLPGEKLVRNIFAGAFHSKTEVAMIYHASLSLNHLIGGIDSQGRWMDGVLLRRIRYWNDPAASVKHNNKQAVQQQSEQEGLHLMILTGPVSYHLEQLLHGIFCQSYRSQYASYENMYPVLSFPTGEMFPVSNSTKIIIETTDIRDMSPSCLALLPVQMINTAAEDCMHRLLAVWMRSLVNWLGDFPPWLDLLEELNRLLLRTKFIEDLLYDDFHHSTKVCTVVVMSKVSAFLRLLEELLLQCHELALQQATFIIPEEKNDSSDSEPERERHLQEKLMNHDHQAKYRGIMSLHPRSRELLNTRARLSVIYAATWGLGGAVNSYDTRRFFDNMLRETVHQFFEGTTTNQQQELPIPADVSIFDCILELPEARMVEALQYDPRTRQRLDNYGLTDKMLEQNVYCELHKAAFASDNDRLIFRTMGNRSVAAAVRVMLQSGANVMLFGPHGCGKSSLILEVLADLKRNCPTPEEMRKQIFHNLVGLVNGASRAEGIFHVLETILAVLKRSSDTDTAQSLPAAAATDDFNTYWREITALALEKVALLQSDERPRHHVQAKTVSSSLTSFRGAEGAGEVRSWLEREFATETTHVLETARFSYGVAFIDDVHCLCDEDEIVTAEEDIDYGNNRSRGNSSNNLNRPEEVLRGILDGFPAFSMARSITVRSSTSLGFHKGSDDACFPLAVETAPILHKEENSDLRVNLNQSDNYMVQRMGFICTGTGHAANAFQSKAIQSLAGKFSCLGMPGFTANELHVSLVSGALVSMASGVRDFSIIELLKNEISILSTITMTVCGKIVSSNDISLTTPLERIMRSFIAMNIDLVAKFCLSLRHGSHFITNPGGLLQLYVHEWKRNLLDPMPYGAQRERITGLLSEQLDSLNDKSWTVTRDWVQGLKDELSSRTDRVWINVDVLKKVKIAAIIIPKSDKEQQEDSDHDEEDAEEDADHKRVQSEYVPVELDLRSAARCISNAAYNPSTQEFQPTLTAKEIAGGDHKIDKSIELLLSLHIDQVQSVLYPAAMSILLRILRIFSLRGKSVLLSGYPGSTAAVAVRLVAKVCDFDVHVFSLKDSKGTVENPPSEKASLSANFRDFLKSMVLKAAGVSGPLPPSNDLVGQQSDQLMYSFSGEPRKILALVNDAQHMLTSDRKMFFHILDCHDPMWMFEEDEIIGICNAFRMHDIEVDMKNNQQQGIDENGVADYNNRPSSTHRSAAGNTSSRSRRTSPRSPRPDNSSINLTTIASHHEGTATDDAGIHHAIAHAVAAAAGSEDPLLGGDHQQVDGTAAAATAGHKTNTNNQHFKGGLTGYTFQWVRSLLQQAMRDYVHIVLNIELAAVTDISRANFLDSAEAKQALKKISGQHLANNKQQRKASNLDSTTATGDVSSNRKDSCSSSSRHYSLLSNRSSSMTSNNGRSKKMYNPVKDQAADLLNVNNDDNGPRTPSNSTNKKANDTLGAHSLFTCPILGPILARRFAWIWYDVDAVDAAAGICNLLMKNDHFYAADYTPTPIVIGLKSTDIGSYQAISPRPDNNTTEEAPPPVTLTRRMSVQERQQLEEEEMRKLKFRATTVLHRFYLSLEGHSQRYQMHEMMSIMDLFGSFKAYEYPSSQFIYDLPQVDRLISDYIEEARSILPHLLKTPLPADVLFFTQPVVTLGCEKIASRASQHVMFLLKTQGLSLLRSRYMMTQVLQGFEGALYALNNTEYMDQRIIENNEELNEVSRRVSHEIDGVRRDLDRVDLDYQNSTAYEQEMMLRSDHHSSYIRYRSFEISLDDLVSSHKRAIGSYTLMDWQGFNSNFTSKPYVKANIELMRALMVVINFTPPKVGKSGDKGAALAKMDDEMVARCTQTLLVKYHDFAASLVGVNPTVNLTATQLHALRIMNTLLNSAHAVYLSAENYSPAARLQFYHKYLSAAVSGNSVFDTLRRYLILLDLSVAAADSVTRCKQETDDLLEEIHVAKDFNDAEKESITNSLNMKMDMLMNNLQRLDETLVMNRKKLDTIEKNKIIQRELIIGIQQARSFINNELGQLNHVLKHLTADICLSVTVLHRAGWFPDFMRQDCAEVLRKNLLSYNIAVSETPFICGCLLDRLQVRRWCSYEEQSLPKDVPSINSVSLLYMSPYHVFVIDPDVMAMSPIISCAPTDAFDVYSIAAQKFTLTLFDSWVKAVLADGSSSSPEDSNNSSSKGMFLVIFDVQAGASDDLLCLLEARLVQDELEEGGGGQRSSYRALTVDTAGIMLDKQQSRIRVPLRFKMVFISTIPPILDANGACSPFPLCCLEAMTVLYWSNSVSASFHVEAKPIQTALELQSATDHTLTQRVAFKLSQYLSPGFAERIVARNEIILDSSTRLIALERSIHNVVYHYMQEENASYNQTLSIDGLLTQEAVSLSILANENIVDKVLKSNQQRMDLTASVKYNSSIMRENISYLSTLHGVLGMSVDFVRLCGKFLPSECFAPYCLSTQAITANLVPSVMNYVLSDSKGFGTYPSSLFKAYKVWTAICSVQRIYRRIKIAGSGVFKINEDENGNSDDEDKDTGKKKVPNTVRETTRIKATSNYTNSNDSAAEAFRQVGFTPSVRTKAVHILSFKLLPLRSLFLREMVRYMQLNIRPGLEYLTKLLLLLSTWAQSEEVPTAEVRALMYMLLESEQCKLRRYCYFYPLRKTDSQLKTRPASAPAILRQQSSLLRLSRGGFRLSNSRGSSSHLQPPPPSSESPMISLTKSRPNSMEIPVDKGDFAEELPMAAMIEDRVTAFRIQSSPPPQSSSSSSPQQARVSNVVNRQRSDTIDSTTGPPQQVDYLELGPGLPDGLWINKRSSKWVVNTKIGGLQESLYRNLRHVRYAFDAGLHVYSDEGLVLQEKQWMLYNTRSSEGSDPPGDSFELEWLKVKGIKAFALNNAKVLRAFGASKGTVEEIGLASTRGSFVLLSSISKEDINDVVMASSPLRSSPSIIGRKTTGGGGRKRFIPVDEANLPDGPLVVGADSLTKQQQQQQTTKSRKSSMISRKSTIHSLFSERSSVAPHLIPAASEVAETGSSPRSHRAAHIQPQFRRLTTRATALLEDITHDATDSRKSVLSQRLSLRVSQRVSQSQSSAQNSSRRISSAVQQQQQQQQQPSRQQSSSAAVFAKQATTIQPKFSPAPPLPQSKGGGPPMSPRGGGGNATNANTHYGDLTEELLAGDDTAYLNLLLLESHPALSSTFRGITTGMGRNLPDFEDWLENIRTCAGMLEEGGKLPASELRTLLRLLRPPRCSNESLTAAADDSNNAATGGIWSRGADLTLLQSMLLVVALWPDLGSSYMDGAYALLAHYLSKEGWIVLHSDEVLVDEDEDEVMRRGSQGNNIFGGGGSRKPSMMITPIVTANSSMKQHAEDDREEDEADDHFDVNSQVMTIIPPAVRKGSLLGTNSSPRSTFLQQVKQFENSSDDDLNSNNDNNNSDSDDDDDNRQTWFDSDLNIAVINKWSSYHKLLKMANAKPLQPPAIAGSSSHSMYIISQRDYANWEGVLLDVLMEPLDVDKFVFMKELRETMSGEKTTYFLVPSVSGPQAAIFSQRARDFALQANKHVPIIFCGSCQQQSEDDGNDCRQQQKLFNLLKHMRLAISGPAKRAILEMLDLDTSLGNALLFAGLSSHMANSNLTSSQLQQFVGGVQGKVNVNQYRTNALRASLLQQQQQHHHHSSVASSSSVVPVPVSVSHHRPSTIQTAAANNTSHSSSSSSSSNQQQQQQAPPHWRDSFPLIISSHWALDQEEQGLCRPPGLLGEFPFAWLPRFFAPDIVRIIPSDENSATGLSSTSSSQSLPSLPESCGVLYEELEAALGWVMTASRSISTTKISTEVRQRLQRASKLELRVAAALISLHQMLQYLHSTAREAAGLPPQWTTCLNSISLWPLSRLILKVCDFLQHEWGSVPGGHNADSLVRQAVFQQGLKVLLESFSRPGSSYYTPQPENGAPIIPVQQQQQQRSSASTSSPSRSASFSLPQPNSNYSNKSPPALSTNIKRTPSMSAAANISTGSNIDSSSSSSSSSNGVGLLSSLRQEILKQTHAVDHLTQKMNQFSSLIAAGGKQQAVRVTKQLKKAQRKLDEARTLYAAELSHLEHFSSFSSRRQLSFTSALMGSNVGNAGEAMRRSFVDRSYRLFAHFLAEVIVAKHISKTRDPTLRLSIRHRDSVVDSINKAVMMASSTQRDSSRMNIASAIRGLIVQQQPAVTTNNKEQGQVLPEDQREMWTWPQAAAIDFQEESEVAFGALLPQDLMRCLGKWVFDGSDDKRSPSVDRHKVLQGIRRLSNAVLHGDITHPLGITTTTSSSYGIEITKHQSTIHKRS